jgi:hypothetical protein
MKKNVGISISKCLKSAAKNRRANQTARAILSAPTVGRDEDGLRMQAARTWTNQLRMTDEHQNY